MCTAQQGNDFGGEFRIGFIIRAGGHFGTARRFHVKATDHETEGEVINQAHRNTNDNGIEEVGLIAVE